MRGTDVTQGSLFSYVSLEARIPKNHPLRRMRVLVDAVLRSMSDMFDTRYSHTGRSSVAPEKLLRALLLQVLCTIRSERQLMGQLDYENVYQKTKNNMKRLRIYHGPANIVGIGGHLAAYQRSQGHNSDFIIWRQSRFFSNHDEVVFKKTPTGLWDRLCMRLLKIKIGMAWMARYDIFHFYFGRSLLPLSIDLPILRVLGKRIIMTYCGSDVRLISIERLRNPYWHIIEKDLKGSLNDIRYDFRKKLMIAWQGVWCHKVLAPRDLYEPVSRYVRKEKVDRDVWIHNLSATVSANSANAYDIISLRQNSSYPRILHMPSNPMVKGTRYFREAIARLREERLHFEYIEVINVAHEEAIDELKKSDIVCDQLLIGAYGSLAVEAMYYGKPVVCYLLNSDIQDEDCPIVNASLYTITDRLRELIINRELRTELGKKGIDYVRRHFDYEEVNKKMLDRYFD